MKKIKFLISAILLLLGFAIVGELHHLCLDNFMNGITYTTLYLQINISENEMKEDILKSAEDNRVDFFVLQTEVKSTFEKEFQIYQSSDKIQKYLYTEFDIEEKEYKSIFSGILKYSYDDYKNITDKRLLENHTYYLVGEKENIQRFKMQLIDKYAGNHPVYHIKNNDSRNTVIIVWLIIYILLLILTVYDQMFRQKEVYIRAAFGERIYLLVLKNILVDCGSYVCIFSISYFLLKQITMAGFYKKISFCMFGIFVFLDSLQYLRWLTLDIKDVLKKHMFSTNILCITYIMKGFTIVFTILIIAANITIVSKCIEYAAQRRFFENYKEYFYTNLDYKEMIGDNGLPIEDHDLVLEKSSIMKEIFYQKYFEQFDPVILTYFGKIENYDMILANINAAEYLFDVIPELKNKVNGERYYYIIPEEMEDPADVCDKIDMWTENYEDKNILEDKIIVSYSGLKKVLNIDELDINGSKYCINPIIVLNMIKPVYDPDTIKPYVFKATYEHDILYKIDKKLFDQFVEENHLENGFHALTNAYEKYEYHWLVLKRVLYINLIFSLLMLLLELIIIHTIIDLEFKINAMDLAIKKVLGYSFWQRYKQIILISTTGSLICMTAGLIIKTYTGINSAFSIAAGGMVIYALDMSAIYFNIKKSEKANISNVLKGEYI